jgi:hypothetical protein
MKWTDDQNNWLIENAKKYTNYDTMLVAFNMMFDSNRSRESIKIRCIKSNIAIGREIGKPYSDEEKAFLLKNCAKMTYQELANELNQRYGRVASKTAIAHYLCDILKASRMGRKTTIRKGERIGKVCNIGNESQTTRGYTLVKVADTGIKNADWKTKQAVVWEQIYGEKPWGIVVFLNANRQDFRKENLYCTSRKVHAIMCSNNWYSENPEITLAALKWCELFYAIKNTKEN